MNNTPTLFLILKGLKSIPAVTTWYIADISEDKGKQALFIGQSSQKLKALREHALVESTVSSNRIEGVEIDKKRIATVVFGKPLLQDRNEEEVQGYRNALEWIHNDNSSIKINESTIKKLHKMCRGNIWDAGKYKSKDGDITEILPTGESIVRFKTLSAAATPKAMKDLILEYNECILANSAHRLLTIAAFNLDFLCIHPFRDGNGRVSRLLLLLQLYHAGVEVGKYISLERLIEENKERYYETLKISSQQWYKGQHDFWAYANFLLYIQKSAYSEFIRRFKKITIEKGGKTDIVIEQIKKLPDGFSFSTLQSKCLDVSKDMIRKVLKDLSKVKKIKSKGKGAGARWYKGITLE